MTNRGSIYHEEAYAQGKMLNHDSWNFLPRKITPSDIDMCFDNGAWLLVCELSSQATKWGEIKYGQRLLYKSLTVRSRVIAALLRHNVKDRQIDTLKDIDSFQVMVAGKTTRVFDGEKWRRFVESFFDDPLKLYMKCCEGSKYEN